jgi:hypothetical protein
MRGAETAWSVQCLGRRLDCRRAVRLPAVARYIFFLCTASKPALGPAQPQIQRVFVASSPGLKRPEREAGHLP